MAGTAAHLVDRVLAEVPIRQWVLTLRYRCTYDARLTSEVLRAFVRSLFVELRRRARNRWGVQAEQCGAVTFIQRFGSPPSSIRALLRSKDTHLDARILHRLDAAV